MRESEVRAAAFQDMLVTRIASAERTALVQEVVARVVAVSLLVVLAIGWQWPPTPRIAVGLILIFSQYFAMIAKRSSAIRFHRLEDIALKLYGGQFSDLYVGRLAEWSDQRGLPQTVEPMVWMTLALGMVAVPLFI